MSNDAGDSSSRLSNALDDIFARRGAESTEAPTETVEGYELPDIVPATEESPQLPPRGEPAPASEPQLPARSTAGPAPAAAPAPAPAPAPSAAPPSTNRPPTGPAPTTQPASSWGDHMPTTTVATPTSGQLRAPGRRPRVRRVTRVLRHVDPWSTFKIALLFSGVAYVVALTSGVLLWRVADATGTLDNVERWFTQFGWETFELKGGEIFHNAWVIGLFGVVFATGAAVLLVTLFNLVSDIVGGIRMTVLEEEVVERTISSTRRYVVRNPASEAALQQSAAPAWSVDDDGDTGGTDDTDAPTSTAAAQPRPVSATEHGNGDGRAGATTGDDTREHPATTWSVD